MNPSAYNASNQYQQGRGSGAAAEVVAGGASSMGGRSNSDSVPPVVPAENRYMGLGSKNSSSTADEFDSFRRNKSQAFSSREPQQPFICYKCNRVSCLSACIEAGLLTRVYSDWSFSQRVYKFINMYRHHHPCNQSKLLLKKSRACLFEYPQLA